MHLFIPEQVSTEQPCFFNGSEAPHVHFSSSLSSPLSLCSFTTNRVQVARQVYVATDYPYAGIKSPNDLLITDRSLVYACIFTADLDVWMDKQSKRLPSRISQLMHRFEITNSPVLDWTATLLKCLQHFGLRNKLKVVQLLRWNTDEDLNRDLYAMSGEN